MLSPSSLILPLCHFRRFIFLFDRGGARLFVSLLPSFQGAGHKPAETNVRSFCVPAFNENGHRPSRHVSGTSRRGYKSPPFLNRPPFPPNITHSRTFPSLFACFLRYFPTPPHLRPPFSMFSRLFPFLPPFSLLASPLYPALSNLKRLLSRKAVGGVSRCNLRGLRLKIGFDPMKQSALRH